MCREIMVIEPFEPDQASDDDHRSCQRRTPVDDPAQSLVLCFREVKFIRKSASIPTDLSQ